jgi:hypothetical protein
MPLMPIEGTRLMWSLQMRMQKQPLRPMHPLLPKKPDVAYEDVTNEDVGAGEAIRTNEAEAIVVDEVNKIAEADEANVIVEIVLVHKAIAVDRANLANEANEASLAEANELLVTNSIAIVIKYLSKLLLDDFIIIFANIC